MAKQGKEENVKGKAFRVAMALILAVVALVVMMPGNTATAGGPANEGVSAGPFDLVDPITYTIDPLWPQFAHSQIPLPHARVEPGDGFGWYLHLKNSSKTHPYTVDPGLQWQAKGRPYIDIGFLEDGTQSLRTPPRPIYVPAGETKDVIVFVTVREDSPPAQDVSFSLSPHRIISHEFPAVPMAWRSENSGIGTTISLSNRSTKAGKFAIEGGEPTIISFLPLDILVNGSPHAHPSDFAKVLVNGSDTLGAWRELPVSRRWVYWFKEPIALPRESSLTLEAWIEPQATLKLGDRVQVQMARPPKYYINAIGLETGLLYQIPNPIIGDAVADNALTVTP